MQVRIYRYYLIVVLVFCLTINIFAAGPINMDRTGSIIVLMEYNDDAVSGGTLTLYHVAELFWSDDQYVFEFTQPFEDCNLSLTELDNQEIAFEYSEFVIDHSILGITKRIDMDGQAEFEDLPLGLYLIVQEDAAAGYFPITPFLISVPMNSEGEWIYDVDATPKIDIEREPTPEEPPLPSDIPQTGQLKWPVPVLAISGVVFFALGWVLCFRRKNKRDET